ncbi:MAG: hypothetical protein ACK5NP_08315 [Pseudanabaena sp.]
MFVKFQAMRSPNRRQRTIHDHFCFPSVTRFDRFATEISEL